MAQTPAATRFSKDQREFYVDQLLPFLDMVYRFSFALTINLNGARKLTEFVYLQLSQNLDMLESSVDPKLELIKTTWESFGKMKKKNWQVEDFPLAQLLNSLDLVGRFSLLACDVTGIALNKVAPVVGKSESDLRDLLLKCREILMNAKI